ncbi:hypothetical protein PIB30_048120 [Stylosanthes scabra]|uniref:Uncharacterized protein n=1 Tax=Stylosanthes scabra TaxID=79078 RepID=A0ABU6ZFP1_9FABA|nr:hypothetical protein [Stylosanthes scabra]
MYLNGLTRARGRRGAGARSFQKLVREHQVLGRGRATAMRARQERGANAPHTCVASAKCGQAHRGARQGHRADAPLRWCERAVAPMMVDFGNLESCSRATKRGGRAITPLDIIAWMTYLGSIDTSSKRYTSASTFATGP